MTVSEFLDLLSNFSDRFDWTLTADTGRYAERRAKARFHLRGSPKSCPAEILDPLQALAFARTGSLADTWAEAAMLLDMNLEDGTALAAAASDRTWTREEGRRVPAAELLDIRQRLMAAVGLIPAGQGQPGGPPAAGSMPEADMSTADFFRQLVDVRDRFDWTLAADTGYFPERRATPRFQLEAVSRNPTCRLDPIRALAYARTGEITDTWAEAAEQLGMAASDAGELAAAAVDRTWVNTGGGRLPSPLRQRLRQQLLEAVGLMAPVAGEESVGS